MRFSLHLVQNAFRGLRGKETNACTCTCCKSDGGLGQRFGNFVHRWSSLQGCKLYCSCSETGPFIFSGFFFSDKILINSYASKLDTINCCCVQITHTHTHTLNMREAEVPWVNIDQEIRSTVCRNNLIFPALGLAGMSLWAGAVLCLSVWALCRICMKEEAHESVFFFFLSLYCREWIKRTEILLNGLLSVALSAQQAAHSAFNVCTHSLKSHGEPWWTSGLVVLHAGPYQTVSNWLVANHISSAWVIPPYMWSSDVSSNSSQPLSLLPPLPCCEGFSVGVQDVHRSSIDTGLDN